MKIRARVKVPTLLALLALLSAGPLPAQGILGQGEGAGLNITSDLPEVMTRPPFWLPATYFSGPGGGSQPFHRGRQGTAKIELAPENRPWSFDTFNGRHALLGVRQAYEGSTRVFSATQSPLEKYDTVAAAHGVARSGGGGGDAQTLSSVPGAAVWEANPLNGHNRANVLGSDGRRARIAAQEDEYLGNEAQVRVEGGGVVESVIVGGVTHPVMEIATGKAEHGGVQVDYTYYVYHQDLSADIRSGRPLPDSRFIAINESRSGGRVVKVKSWFTRRGRIGVHDDGEWGNAHLRYNPTSNSWEQSWQKPIQARYVAGSGDSGRYTLRWGPSLEHVVRNVTPRVIEYERYESDLEGRRGRLASQHGEPEVQVFYQVDAYDFDAGVEQPGGGMAKNQLLFFPSRETREALQRRVARRYPGRDWRQYLPENSGWILRKWVVRETQEGVSWSGHCAGFAAAAVLFKEPPNSKVVPLPAAVKKVRLKARHAREARSENLRYETFGSPITELTFDNRDLKGLMIELGQAVDVDLEHPDRDSVDRETPGVKIDYPRNADGTRARHYSRRGAESWDDILPHNMHVILLDFLRNRKRPVVVDRHPCAPVWNSPVYGYEFTVTGLENPRRYDVTAQILYAGYGDRMAGGLKSQTTRRTQPKTYPKDGVAPYEGNALGQIIRGEALRFELQLDSDNRVNRSFWKGQELECTYALRDDSSGRVLTDSSGRTRTGKRKVYVHPDFIWAPYAIVMPEPDRNTRRVNSNPKVMMSVLLDRSSPILGERSGSSVQSYLQPWVQLDRD